MEDEYMFWRCGNYDCQARNKIKCEKVKALILQGGATLLVCNNCGLVNNPLPKAVFQEIGSKTWLPCIAFEGSERKLPTGHTPDGWKDYLGRPISRANFIRKYKVDPEINWKWRMNGCPKAVD